MSDDNDEIIQHIQKLMAKVLKQEQITNYSLDIKSVTTKGDCYMSVIYQITAKGESQGNHQWKKNFVAKVAINDEAIRKMMSTRFFFGIEMRFYEMVFPAFFEFQKKKQLIKFEHVGKCFLTDFEEGKETLIFEDLKANGFDVWNRRLPMPETHILEVLKIYSYYHAVSFALRDQQPKIFEKILEGYVNPLHLWVGIGQPKNTFLDVLNWYVPYIEEKATEKFLNKFKNFIESWDALMLMGDEKNPQMVINHGDSWCNNIMFKKTQNGSLDARLLDFQCCRLASPAVDINYFFFASATGDILKKFDYYMEIYYNSFSGFLKELGSDPKNLFSYEDFREHLTSYGKTGLVISLVAIKFLYVEGDEVPEFKPEQTDRFVVDIKETVKVQERVKAILEVADEKGII